MSNRAGLKSEFAGRVTARYGLKYAVSMVTVALAVFITNLLSSYWGYTFPTAMFFPAIIVTTWMAGFGPGLLTVSLAVFSVVYFFSPSLTFPGKNYDEISRIILFMISALTVFGLVIGQKKARNALLKARKELDLKVQERTAALRQSEEQIRLMVENVQDYAIFMLDIHEKIKSWNSGAERITGYKSGEIIGKHFSVLYFSDDPPNDDPMVRFGQALANGQSEAEGWRRRKNGTKFYANEITTSIRDEGGTLRGYSIVIRDLTEKRLADDKLKTLQGELAHITRVMMMGELTASIAHELNQPLGAIVNYGSASRRLLSAGTSRLAEVDRALSCMIEDANRASAIITRIRRLLKKAEPELGLLNLKGVVEDVLVLTKSEMAKRKIRIRLEIPDHLPKIVGDRIQIQQVLMNLVMNGMEAMNASPSISRTIQIRGDCRHDQDPGKAWVQVSVQDSGTGLKEDEINRLFEAFYSTKPSGLGMGLAICRTIVDSHGGRLWATSNPGPGTTFHFILPAAEAGI